MFSCGSSVSDVKWHGDDLWGTAERQHGLTGRDSTHVAWDLIPGQPLSSLLFVSVPQFLHLYGEDNNSSFPHSFVLKLTCLEQCQELTVKKTWVWAFIINIILIEIILIL